MKGDHTASWRRAAGKITVLLFSVLTLTSVGFALHSWRAVSPTKRPSVTSVPQMVRTSTPTATATNTSTPTATQTPTYTPTALPPSATPSPTHTATITPTPEPQPTPDGVYREVRVPILMFHYISTPPEGADAIRRDLSTSPERFEAYLRWLKEAGFVTISLHDLILHLTIGYPLPEKPLIITFDDGYEDNYTNAFPLLQKYGFTATFFLITSFLDQGRPEYLSWDQVIELHQAGMEFGAHSYDHPDLRGKSVDYLVWESLGPRQAIEARIGEPVRFFAYPSGKYDQQVIDVIHSAHYWGAVTAHQGIIHRSDRLFELKRIRVHGDYTLERFIKVMDYWLTEGK